MPSVSDYRIVLGRAIREQRKRADLTQEELAERADMHPNYLGRVERGEETVSLRALLKITRGLGVELSELVRGLK
ncbi:MAG: helix-turn-helix domain-containing protein [Limisphaerales bacterium]